MTRFVTAGVWQQSGVHGTPFDHVEDVKPDHASGSEMSQTIERPQEQTCAIVLDPQRVQIGISGGLRLMIRRHFMKLAALLMQAKPPAFAVSLVITDVLPITLLKRACSPVAATRAIQPSRPT
jgi:hypothetical protein